MVFFLWCYRGLKLKQGIQPSVSLASRATLPVGLARFFLVFVSFGKLLIFPPKYG